MTAQLAVITSRDNPLLVRVRRIAQDSIGYRRTGSVWLEGEHICAALKARRLSASQALIAESAWSGDPALRELAGWAPSVAVVADTLFKTISTLKTPPRIGFLLPALQTVGIDPRAASIVLDRLQDPGNVGSILRSAAAFGVGQVLALVGTAALWSPKVLRAGMGAHFALRLVEGVGIDALSALEIPLVATSSHAELALNDAVLPQPCAWVLGHEGQGVCEALLQRCAMRLRIPQPGGEESLNVAAAAAVCLYASASSPLATPPPIRQ